MPSEVRKTPVGGKGKRAEIDGGFFGGYVKPANLRENRRDRRLRQNQSGKRKVVVVIRERGPEGKTLPGVFATEADALAFIARQVPRGNGDLRGRGIIMERAARPATSCTRSITKKPIACRVRSTRTTPRAFSAGCAGAKLATSIISPART
jgi:ISXO2-like transposase domain